MSEVWEQRAQEILSDPAKAKRAALLLFLVEQHLQHCFHTRKCPEQGYAEELDLLLR